MKLKVKITIVQNAEEAFMSLEIMRAASSAGGLTQRQVSHVDRLAQVSTQAENILERVHDINNPI